LGGVSVRAKVNPMDSTIKRATQIFQDFLKGRNLKVTGERKIILDAVFKTHDHFDVEELYKTIQDLNHRVSKATIYRTLELFVECGLVNKLSLGDSFSRYEHIYGHEHHDHLICVSCGKIIEFFNEDLEKLQDKICRDHNFKETDHSLRIFGHCEDCAGSG